MTYPQLDLAQASLHALIKTNHGDIKVALFPELAPKTVANFVGLAKQGYYDGVIFHRVIEDFMIQGATQAVPVWVARASMARASKMSSHESSTT